MRNKRFFIVLVGALIFGVLAAVSVSKYLSSAQAYSKNLNKVAVAKVAIPLGTKIIPEQIMVVQFPKESTPDGAFETPEKLTGRVAVVNIAAREPITETKLAAEGTAAGLSAVIPEGYRAMTVKVDDAAGISGFIMPGSLVDVVVTIDPREGSGHQDPVSKIVLQNIKVLANGQNIDKPENEREANSVKAVTLQVTPEQAEKLALAATEGKLQLVMRNQVDQGDEKTPGVNKRNLLGGDIAQPVPDPGSLKSEQPKTEAKPMRKSAPAPKQSPAAPAPQPTPRASVEMIEGAKKRSVEFP
jgi:pilus assembly protein CpaB